MDVLRSCSAHHRDNIAVAAVLSHDQLQTRPTSVWQSQGECNESNTHVLRSLPGDWQRLPADVQQLLAMDHSAELFPKLRTPTDLTDWAKNKTHTSQFINRDWDFFVSKRVIHGHDLIQLEVVRMTMFEEKIMDFCTTTM